jgi:hypothetical protein
VRRSGTADIAQAERPDLFSKKLAVCAVVYEFRTEDQAEAKEEKRQTLLELIDFVNVKKSITEAMYKETIDMVRAAAACPHPPPLFPALFLCCAARLHTLRETRLTAV